MIELIMMFFLNTEYNKVADIITAQSILETGWYKSEVHNKKHNYFSLKGNENPECSKPICRLRTFRTTEQGLFAQLSYYRNKHYPTNRKGFINALKSKGYAEDKNYIKKVLNIARGVNNAKQIKQRSSKNCKEKREIL